MFDEMDSIAKNRDRGEASGRVVNQILANIDGLGATKNIFLIGSINGPDVLVPTIIRMGRWDQLIYITLPDLESRIFVTKSLYKGQFED